MRRCSLFGLLDGLSVEVLCLQPSGVSFDGLLVGYSTVFLFLFYFFFCISFRDDTSFLVASSSWHSVVLLQTRSVRSFPWWLAIHKLFASLPSERLRVKYNCFRVELIFVLRLSGVVFHCSLFWPTTPSVEGLFCSLSSDHYSAGSRLHECQHFLSFVPFSFCFAHFGFHINVVLFVGAGSGMQLRDGGVREAIPGYG
jgi:hypothetical protein